MRSFTRCIIGLAVVALLPGSSLQAEELTAEKKAAIKQIMELTGAGQIGEMFAAMFSEQMNEALKAADSHVPPKAFDIVSEETRALIKAEFAENGSYYDVVYPIYHKFFTLEELNGLLAFYKTPLGRKLIVAMPQLLQESMAAGQKWGETLTPEIQKRVLSRLEKEGIAMGKH